MVRPYFQTYIEANSDRTTKTHAVPIQTKMKPYTVPAGPPLLLSGVSAVFQGRDTNLVNGWRNKLYNVSTKSILYFTTYHVRPSQVTRIVQLNPSIDTRPKFRCLSQLSQSLDSASGSYTKNLLLAQSCQDSIVRVAVPRRAKLMGFAEWSFHAGVMENKSR